MAQQNNNQSSQDQDDTTVSAQERRDAHYFEDGVDAKGNAPKGKEFEADGTEVDAKAGED